MYLKTFLSGLGYPSRGVFVAADIIIDVLPEVCVLNYEAGELGVPGEEDQHVRRQGVSCLIHLQRPSI